MQTHIQGRDDAPAGKEAATPQSSRAVAVPSESGPLTVARVLALQRAVGNHAVAGALRGVRLSRGRGALVSRYLEDIGPESFTGKNLTASDESKAKKGQMSSAIPVTYSGTVHPRQGRDEIEPEVGSFEGYFKADVTADPLGGHHRGKYAGMPVANPEFAKRNIATYELSKLLEEPIIPPTYAAKLGDKQGLVMQKAEGVSGKEPEAEQHRKDPVVQRALANLAMLDVICGQVDRHPGNYIIELKDGKPVGVKGIDNDLAFGSKYESIEHGFRYRKGAFSWVAGKYVQDLADIDRPYAERIVKLAEAPDTISNVLTGLLVKPEIDATLNRLKSLAGFLRPLLEKTDGPVKTEWK
jgi:hypothetical protein